MEKEVIKITLTDDKASLLSSKVGGSFLWPDDNPPGIFLAQINLAELPHTEELPDKGWLQFFGAEEWPKDGYVIYRESLSGIEMKNTGITSGYDKNTPVIKEAGMHFEYGKESLSCVDYRFDSEKYSDEEMEKLWDTRSGDGSKLLGFPYFCQEDPRGIGTEKYDTLLFQLDSDFKHVMWGDSGVGNYFINSEALKRRDFSDILFYWDCM